MWAGRTALLRRALRPLALVSATAVASSSLFNSHLAFTAASAPAEAVTHPSTHSNDSLDDASPAPTMTASPAAVAALAPATTPAASSADGISGPRFLPAHPRQPITGDIRADMESLVFRIQDEVCDALTAIDGTPFKTDTWTRPEGGGGRSRVLQGGAVFEKAGVNVSVVTGQLPKAAALQMLDRKKAVFSGPGPFPFYATGVSMVVHPANPLAPTMHANFRLFQVTGVNAATGEPEDVWWFGGGSDLTPSYLYEEDAAHFHGVIKAACDAHDTAYYPRFKAWCDTYFFIPHRGETRGVGGFFFDDLTGGSSDPYDVFPFMGEGESEPGSYLSFTRE